MWRARKRSAKPYSEQLAEGLAEYRRLLEESKKPVPKLNFGSPREKNRV
jgi:hypothetical protein